MHFVKQNVIIFGHMAINIDVEKNSGENNVNLLRRFTKKVQGSGILPRVRSIRYASRKLSSYKTKMKTLEGIRRRADREELIKLGKIVENAPRKK